MDRRRAARLSLASCAVLTAILILSIVGCIGRVTPAELYGQWEKRTKEDAQILQLNRDGTFAQAWTSEGKEKVAIGKWELVDVDRAPAILLKYHRDFDNHSSGASLNVVRQWSGDIGLSADPDRQSIFQRRDAGTN